MTIRHLTCSNKECVSHENMDYKLVAILPIDYDGHVGDYDDIEERAKMSRCSHCWSKAIWVEEDVPEYKGYWSGYCLDEATPCRVCGSDSYREGYHLCPKHHEMSGLSMEKIEVSHMQYLLNCVDSFSEKNVLAETEQQTLCKETSHGILKTYIEEVSKRLPESNEYYQEYRDCLTEMFKGVPKA